MALTQTALQMLAFEMGNKVAIMIDWFPAGRRGTANMGLLGDGHTTAEQSASGAIWMGRSRVGEEVMWRWGVGGLPYSQKIACSARYRPKEA